MSMCKGMTEAANVARKVLARDTDEGENFLSLEEVHAIELLVEFAEGSGEGQKIEGEQRKEEDERGETRTYVVTWRMAIESDSADGARETALDISCGE